MAADDADRDAVLRRLARIEGQVRGIARMVESGESCEDILVQVAAAKSALDRVGIHMISHQLRDCVAAGAADTAEAIQQALDTFIRFSSSMGPLRPED